MQNKSTNPYLYRSPFHPDRQPIIILKFVIGAAFIAVFFLSSFLIDKKPVVSTRRTNPASENYQTYCSSCHGKKVEAFVDRKWKYGTSKDELMKSVLGGHRNPQGLFKNPATGEIWETEHGPRGGDELNLIKKGANYGWPVICYGINYDGEPITNLTAKEGMEQPLTY